MTRYALITTTSDRDNVAAYLPSNYRVIHTEPRDLTDTATREGWKSVVIEGKDTCGWTLDSYVLPRLASGNLHAVEIDLSHPVMKRIPLEKRVRPGERVNDTNV